MHYVASGANYGHPMTETDSASRASTPPPLVQLMTAWHARLRQSAPPGVAPRLRMLRGAPLLRGERAARAGPAVSQALALAGQGLEPAPPGFAGVSLRPKVTLDVHTTGAGTQLQVSYFGRVPGVRALAETRSLLGDQGYVCVRGGAGKAIELQIVLAEPPRSLALVHVEAGGLAFAVPMNFVSMATPRDDAAAESRSSRTACLATCLGLSPMPSQQGRPAQLILTGGERPLALKVDAVLGHRRQLVHGVGPLLGLVPWLLGAVHSDDAAPIPVVHPRRLIAGARRRGAASPGRPTKA